MESSSLLIGLVVCQFDLLVPFIRIFNVLILYFVLLVMFL